MAKKRKTGRLTKTQKSLKLSRRVSLPQQAEAILESKQIKTISQQLRLDESYISLVLGATVVLAVSILFFIFLKESRHSELQKISPTPSVIGGQTENKTYIMQDGESLWDIAVKFYGDGFAWVEIVEANKEVITNPDYIPPGTKIIIPNIK